MTEAGVEYDGIHKFPQQSAISDEGSAHFEFANLNGRTTGRIMNPDESALTPAFDPYIARALIAQCNAEFGSYEWSALDKILRDTRRILEESPFDQLDAKRNYREQLREITRSIGQDIGQDRAEYIVNRIEYLAEPEDDDDVLPTLASVGRLIQFLAINKHVANPTLSITPSGNIYAQWRVHATRKFSVEFLPNGSIYYVLFTPSQQEAEPVISISGLEFVDSVMRLLKHYDIETLIGDANNNT